MKSQVFILLMGIALLKVSLVLAEGEEATTVAGAEASAVNSTVSDGSASVPPPSPQEADGAAGKTATENICKLHDEQNSKAPDSNYKCTDTYYEGTDGVTGKCVRIYYRADLKQSEPEDITTCGLGGGAIAGIIIGVLILVAVAAAGLYYYLKKKQGVANPFGQLMQNARQPAAAPPASVNQSPPAPNV